MEELMRRISWMPTPPHARDTYLDHITVEGENILWLLVGTHHSLDPQEFLLAREGPQDWVAYKEGKGVM